MFFKNHANNVIESVTSADGVTTYGGLKMSTSTSPARRDREVAYNKVKVSASRAHDAASGNPLCYKIRITERLPILRWLGSGRFRSGIVFSC